MHENDLGGVGEIFQPVPDRFASRRAARRDHQAIDVALKDPRRRIGDVAGGQHDNDADDVRPRHEGLEAVEQDRLPRYPAKLFELTTTCSRAASAGHDHDTDVARLVHANNRFKRSWICLLYTSDAADERSVDI